jgi:hypothetical protein
MTAAIANLALNVLMVALLVATIAYCWLLNKRIQILQDSKGELANLMRHFDESTQRASDSIMALQNASKKIGENMQTRIDKANFLLDDLAFMIEKGNKLANQMEASLAVGRARNKVMSQKIAEPQVDNSWLSEEEPEEPSLPESLHMAASGAVRKQPEKSPGIKEKTAASLGAVLERLSNRNTQHAHYDDVKPEPSPRSRPAFAGADKQEGRPRSKVEQELLDIIRAGVKG